MFSTPAQHTGKKKHPAFSAKIAREPLAQKSSDITCDVVIVGCGVAGLYTALNLPRTFRIVMLSKSALDECDSMLAQGGMCVLPEAKDYDSFFEDTLRAGHNKNCRKSLDIMIRSSRAIANDLLALGVNFNYDQNGNLAFTREAAHARPRIIFHNDITGKAITDCLRKQVLCLSNVTILDYTAMIDLIVNQKCCKGVLACRVSEALSRERAERLRDRAASGLTSFTIHARSTVLATGGVGGRYDRSTNYPQLTGDACVIAASYGLAVEPLDAVQIHPTGLYSTNPGRTFLISESCRGEGAVLLNAKGQRFTDELQPRDVLAGAEHKQMKADKSNFEWLSFLPINPQVVRTHFKNIRTHCLQEGKDILQEPIPIVPTQHYFMGGIKVDQNSATAMKNLYAVGETSCNGVHGKNRLASNSLLEALVFARRAAFSVVTGKELKVEEKGRPPFDGKHRGVQAVQSALDDMCTANPTPVRKRAFVPVRKSDDG